jgi:hypothetical protein
MGHELGKAAVQYGDLRGTTSIDGPDDPDALYELAGISAAEWFIVAYEIYGGYDFTSAYVWAVPAGEAIYDDWAASARQGERTVKARRFDFQVDDEAAAFKLLAANKRWSIHAVFRSIADLDMDVERDE